MNWYKHCQHLRATTEIWAFGKAPMLDVPWKKCVAQLSIPLGSESAQWIDFHFLFNGQKSKR